jgi:hypothetical protein
MGRTKLVLAVATAMAAMMTLAGPAFASIDGSCIQMPISPIAAAAAPITSLTLLFQLAVAVAVAVVAAVAQAPASTVRPRTFAGTT